MKTRTGQSWAAFSKNHAWSRGYRLYVATAGRPMLMRTDTWSPSHLYRFNDGGKRHFHPGVRHVDGTLRTMTATRQSTTGRVDVEFSLALHNRTGKYFIGRDILEDNAGIIENIWYWRAARRDVPGGLEAKLLGRALVVELDLRGRSKSFDHIVPRFRPAHPVLHMDPFTAPAHQLRPSDIVLCHDMGTITHPELFMAKVAAGYVTVFDEIQRVGPHMVFVSEASRTAFHELYGDRVQSSRVIYPAIRREVDAAGAAKSSPVVAGPFLLMVGSVGARKNQLRVIHAFERSGLAEKGVALVICGGWEPGYEAVAPVAERTENVKLIGYADDAVLNWLYANAQGFVLPSLLEGFGIPVAEAIQRGLVPLVSRGGVLEEVAGEGALLTDPLDEAEIAEGLKVLAFMPEEERRRRRESLSASILRFSRDAFRKQWGELLTQVAGAA